METTTHGPIGADPDDLSPADRRVADMIEAMPLEGLPEGAEERMIERAQSAGLVESTQPLYRLWTGGGNLPLRVHRDYYGRRTADELRAWARERHVLPEMERAIEAGGGEGSRGSYEIGTAAGRPELTWRIEPWQPEMDPWHGTPWARREQLAGLLAERAAREVREAAAPGEIVDAAAESDAQKEYAICMDLSIEALRQRARDAGVRETIARAALAAVGYRPELLDDLAGDLDRVEDVILDPVAAIENGAASLLTASERRRRARLPEVSRLTRLTCVLAARASGHASRGMIPGGEDEAAYQAAVDRGIEDPEPVWT